MKKLLWGIDLGGTKIEGVVLEDAAALTPLARVRISTEAQKGYDHILSRIAELVEALEKEVKSTAETIGFGTPGSFDPQLGSMKNSNTTCLNKRDLPGDIAKILGKKVIIANDANCFALAESRFGAALGAGSVFGIIMGTGVGGGIVINGQVVNGAQGIAGEWGHNILIPDGEACYCGRRGCVETVLSGPALERFYEKRSGEKRGLAEICVLAKAEEAAAKETIHHLLDQFGRAIAVVINILDPEVIVLGGGVSNVAALQSGALEAVKPHVFNTRVGTKIVPNRLGDSAGVFGAAVLSG